MAKAILSKHRRAKQWAVFSRVWHLYDAKWQNPFESADLIAKYLSGRNKPIFHTLSDCGDHVVVINTAEVAMPDREWKYRMYQHHTMYARGLSFTPLWEVHNQDPTKVLWKAVYRACGSSLLKHTQLQRLHLFPGTDIPEEIKVNICSQIRQLKISPKRLREFTQEELKEFPKLFDWPEDYVKT